MKDSDASRMNVSADSAVAYLRFPRLTSLARVREELSLPFSRLVAEVGGYAGLFLGLSFWGVYAAACRVAKVVERAVQMKRKRKNQGRRILSSC